MIRFLIAILFLIPFLFTSCTHDPFPVSTLSYSPSQVTVDAGVSWQSVTPTLNGPGPFSFSLNTTPENAGISIDESGVIHGDVSLLPGTYVVSVKVNNQGGETIFENVFSVQVYATVTFSAHIKPLVAQYCGPCHIYPGGPLTYYVDYNNMKSNIAGVLASVQLDPAAPGYMPKFMAPLSASNIDLIKKWVDQGFPE